MSSQGSQGERGEPGERRFKLTPGTVAGGLTLLAALIGLITVIIERSGGQESAGVTPVLEPQGSGGGGDGEEPGGTGSGSGGGGEAQPDPAHSGNSRSDAKELRANLPLAASIAAGNDRDWYVYQASEEETATVEVVPFEGSEGSDILVAVVFEGLQELESSADVSTIEPLVVPRGVAAGTRLFVRVEDLCGGSGCSVGQYKVVVRTGPPG